MIVIIKISKKTVKAIKKHKCSGCGQPIYPGKRHIHEKYFDLDDGKWVNNRYHSTTCEFEHIDRQSEAQELYDNLEAQHSTTDCIFTTPAINPMTEELDQYDDTNYETWDKEVING